MSQETLTPQIRGIDPIALAFTQKINSAKGPQIYEMSPADARKALIKVQQQVSVSLPPVDSEELSILGGPKGNVPVRIIRPQGSTATLTPVVYIHGAGWVMGDRETYDRLVREICVKSNCALFFVDYSRSPEARYPVAIEECYLAAKYVAENGKKHNVNSSKLTVAGDSVGGNMTAAVTLLAKQRNGPKISLQVMFYPVADAGFDTGSYRQYATGFWLTREAMKWFWDQYLPDKAKRKEPTASPLQASTEQLSGLPPALVITNEFDVLRDEGEAYAHKLIDAGVKVRSIRLLGIIHDCVMLHVLAQTPAATGAIDLACETIKSGSV